MKFGKLVSRARAGDLLPDLAHLCIRYKELKKLLKAINPEHEGNESISLIQQEADQRNSRASERAFFDMLHEDVKRLNAYFCDKEEEVVIWLQQLDEQLGAAQSVDEKQLCHLGYIHLHGQLVLLFHWSMLNYAALVKILKKHDKLSGMELKAPVLSNALKQPFSTTGTLSSLMARCEGKVKELDESTGGFESLLEAYPQYRDLILRQETEVALSVWSDLRSNASTPSTFLEPGFVRAGPMRPASESADQAVTPAATASSTRAAVGNDAARASAQPQQPQQPQQRQQQGAAGAGIGSRGTMSDADAADADMLHDAP